MKYPFTVYQTQVEGHVFWVAECPSLKGCVGQGDSLEDACNELELNEAEWLEAARKYNIAIPPVPLEAMNAYSGKFTSRVSPLVHTEAAKFAKKQGISLNQYVNDAIVAQNSRMATIEYIAPVIKNAAMLFRSLLSEGIPTISEGTTKMTLDNVNKPYNVSYLNVQ